MRLVDLEAQYRVLRPRIEARIRRVLDSGQFILGPELGELESALAAFAGVAHAVGVGSGTDALWLGLRAEGIGPDDAVFVPAFTFVATAEVVVTLGAAPVFVDIDPVTFTMDPDHLAARIAAVRRAGTLRPRAVVPVDLYGLPADYDAIARIADPAGLFVLADAAQSFGASCRGRRVGTLAAATATSFYPSKPLGGYGDGGCLFATDAARAETYRSLRHHGAQGERTAHVGVNSRLDTLQAAILLAKLEVFEDELAARERVAGWYDARLPGAIRRQARPDGFTSAWSCYSVLLPDRAAVMRALADDAIDSRVYYAEPIHLQPPYERYGEGPGSLPVSERISREVLSLPMHPYLDRATVERVCQVIARAVA